MARTADDPMFALPTPAAKADYEAEEPRERRGGASVPERIDPPGVGAGVAPRGGRTDLDEERPALRIGRGRERPLAEAARGRARGRVADRAVAEVGDHGGVLDRALRPLGPLPSVLSTAGESLVLSQSGNDPTIRWIGADGQRAVPDATETGGASVLSPSGQAASGSCTWRAWPGLLAGP